MFEKRAGTIEHCVIYVFTSMQIFLSDFGLSIFNVNIKQMLEIIFSSCLIFNFIFENPFCF